MNAMHIAAAACAAGRWFSAGALLLIATALLVGAFRPPAGPLPGALLLAGLGLGAVQMVLAARIEFDLGIFAALARGDDVGAGLAAFDRDVRTLGLGGGPREARTPEQRAAGAARLVRWSGILFVAQLALVAAGIWLMP